MLLVGLVGAAAAVWQAGRRGAGVALLGVPLIVPVLTSLVLSTFLFERSEFLPIAGLVLVTAAVPTFASLGTLLVPADIPAAFVGIAVGVAGAFGGISSYLAFSPADGQAKHSGTYLLVIVPLVVAGGLIVLAHRRWGPVVTPRADLEPVTVA